LPSRSRSAAGWLIRKEWRDLFASRSWWVLLALVGPLVGVTFTSAVRTYSEISDGAGAGCGAVCAPLIGVWGPTFAAYEIAAVFLLPFVAIRLVSGDRHTGALKLELQRPMSGFTRLAVKMQVLLAGCAIAAIAGVIAIGLWASYGGSVSWPEVAVVGLGHLLNAAITIAVATLASVVTEHPSTAAIVTLSITVGTWIVQFAAALYGGVWSRVATLTPGAMISTFSHGLLPVGGLLAGVAIVAGLLLAATSWLRLGDPPRKRTTRGALCLVATGAVALVFSTVNVSWDASEGRLNSFTEVAQEQLERIGQPIRIEAHLAPEDPRRVDLERHALAKLGRAVPRLQVTFVSRTSTGMYELTDPSYGEIRYDVGNRRVVGRATTDEAVLEAIFEAAGVDPDPDSDEAAFAGHPLVTRPKGAAFTFFGLWPAAAALIAWLSAKQRSPVRPSAA
jgi:ABC-type transport system involved in multi-copper enzyme maturation permease subunit